MKLNGVQYLPCIWINSDFREDIIKMYSYPLGFGVTGHASISFDACFYKPPRMATSKRNNVVYSIEWCICYINRTKWILHSITKRTKCQLRSTASTLHCYILSLVVQCSRFLCFQSEEKTSTGAVGALSLSLVCLIWAFLVLTSLLF